MTNFENIIYNNQAYFNDEFIRGFTRGGIFNLWSLPFLSKNYHSIAGCVTGAGLQFAVISSLYEFWPGQVGHGLMLAGIGATTEIYLEYEDI